jgi:hypothetical protein
MRRNENPKLLKADSVDVALSELLVGVPTLSVRMENRRSVFVESTNDQRFHSKLVRQIAQTLSSERSLEFIAVGNSEKSGGRPTVIKIVGDLQTAGNSSVRGLVDRDERAPSEEYVECDSSRYTLENFLFDPLALGLLFLRDRIDDLTSQMADVTYVNIDLSKDGQHLLDVMSELNREHDSDRTPANIQYGNTILDVEQFWLEEKGHALNDRLRARWPQLGQYAGTKRLSPA